MQEYTLNCDNCGIPYKSKEGFPSPQICLACKTKQDEKLLLTPGEVKELFSGKIELEDGDIEDIYDSLKPYLEAQLAKAKQHYEQERLDREPVRARDIGMGRKNKSTPYIKSVCLNCGKGRWVKANRPTSKGFTGLCKACSDTGSKRRRYKDDGYWFVPIKPDDFYFPMANNQGYIQEHRYLMAQYLGRILESGEIVHHKNEIKDDNRMDNLELLTGASAHMYIHREAEGKAELREEIPEGFISDDAMNGLSWLTEHDRMPTWLELDRYIRALGYCKLALIPDIEKATKRIKELQETCAYWERLTKECVEEAKREERERLLALIDTKKDLVHIDYHGYAGQTPNPKCKGCQIEQALKETNGR